MEYMNDWKICGSLERKIDVSNAEEYCERKCHGKDAADDYCYHHTLGHDICGIFDFFTYRYGQYLVDLTLRCHRAIILMWVVPSIPICYQSSRGSG